MKEYLLLSLIIINIIINITPRCANSGPIIKKRLLEWRKGMNLCSTSNVMMAQNFGGFLCCITKMCPLP